MSLTIDTTIKATTAAHPTNDPGICIRDAAPADAVTLLDTIPSNPAGGRTWEVEYWPSNINTPPTVTNSTANPATFTVPQEGGYQILLTRLNGDLTVESEHRIFIGVPHTDGNTIPCAGLDSDLINDSEDVNGVGWAGGAGESSMLEAVVRDARDDIEAFGEMVNIAGTVLAIGEPATDITIGATAGAAPVTVQTAALSVKAPSGLAGLIALPDFGGGGGTLLVFGADNQAAVIGQLTPEDAGPNVATGTVLASADGRPQDGVEDNNDGTPLYLRPGKPGSGGSGDPGKPGPVFIGPSGALYPNAGAIRVPNPEPHGDLLLGVKNRAGGGNLRLFNLRALDAFDVGEDDLGDVAFKLAAGKGFSVTANSVQCFHTDTSLFRVTVNTAIHELTDTAWTFGGSFSGFVFPVAASNPISFTQPGGTSDWLFESGGDLTLKAGATDTFFVYQGTDQRLVIDTNTSTLSNPDGGASVVVNDSSNTTVHADNILALEGVGEFKESGGIKKEEFFAGATATAVVTSGQPAKYIVRSTIQTANATPVVMHTFTLPADLVGTVRWWVQLKSGANVGSTLEFRTLKQIGGTATLFAGAYLAATSAPVINDRDAALAAAVLNVTAAGATIVFTPTGIAATVIDWALFAEFELFKP